LAERKRLELLKRLSPLDGLAIRSNTIMGPFLVFYVAGRLRTSMGFKNYVCNPTPLCNTVGALPIC
jgi:hypothetical protein